MSADALGNPLAFTLTAASEADISQAQPLLAALVRDGHFPTTLIADKGYDADALVAAIEDQGGQAVIPPRRSRKTLRAWDRHRYQARHLIENLFAHLKHYRRLATRYDKLDAHFAAFLTLAAIRVWLA